MLMKLAHRERNRAGDRLGRRKGGGVNRKEVEERDEWRGVSEEGDRGLGWEEDLVEKREAEQRQ